MAKKSHPVFQHLPFFIIAAIFITIIGSAFFMLAGSESGVFVQYTVGRAAGGITPTQIAALEKVSVPAASKTCAFKPGCLILASEDAADQGAALKAKMAPQMAAQVAIIDNCPTVYNPNQLDQDKDRVGDACDNCPTVNNFHQDNRDGDVYGDYCDMCPDTASSNNRDSDGDRKGDVCDNCPTIKNADQLDTDQDSVGNLCDPTPTSGTPGPGSGPGSTVQPPSGGTATLTEELPQVPGHQGCKHPLGKYSVPHGSLVNVGIAPTVCCDGNANVPLPATDCRRGIGCGSIGVCVVDASAGCPGTTHCDATIGGSSSVASGNLGTIIPADAAGVSVPNGWAIVMLQNGDMLACPPGTMIQMLPASAGGPICGPVFGGSPGSFVVINNPTVNTDSGLPAPGPGMTASSGSFVAVSGMQALPGAEEDCDKDGDGAPERADCYIANAGAGPAVSVVKDGDPRVDEKTKELLRGYVALIDMQEPSDSVTVNIGGNKVVYVEKYIPPCGNGAFEFATKKEMCDLSALNQPHEPPNALIPNNVHQRDCSTLRKVSTIFPQYEGGVAKCTSKCVYDINECYACGDTIVHTPEEQCEAGMRLDCKKFDPVSFGSGVMTCDAGCQWEKSKCSMCQNARVDANEACDPTASPTIPCRDTPQVKALIAAGRISGPEKAQGFAPCDNDCSKYFLGFCTIDLCKNKYVDPGEACDGREFESKSCNDFMCTVEVKTPQGKQKQPAKCMQLAGLSYLTCSGDCKQIDPGNCRSLAQMRLDFGDNDLTLELAIKGQKIRDADKAKLDTTDAKVKAALEQYQKEHAEAERNLQSAAPSQKAKFEREISSIDKKVENTKESRDTTAKKLRNDVETEFKKVEKRAANDDIDIGAGLAAAREQADHDFRPIFS